MIRADWIFVPRGVGRGVFKGEVKGGYEMSGERETGYF
jgi:hypothetical protein